METISQIVEGKVLSQVINLPKSFQNILVEIIIKPSIKEVKPPLNRKNLRALIHGSHTESLSGILKNQSDINLEELRRERREKYEYTD